MADVYNLGFGGMNPYTQGAVNSTMQDMAQNYNMISRPQQENAMVGSGSFGNSGLQQMRQLDDKNQLQVMGNVAGNMRNNAFLGQQQFGLQAQNQQYNQQMGNQQFGLNQQNQDFNQGMANKQFDADQYWTGQNFDANQYNTGFNQNQTQLQNYMELMNQANSFGQQDIANGTTVQNAPLDYFGQFNNIANSIGGYGGTSTTSQNNQGNPLLGALGGWQLGSSIAGAK